MMEKTPLPQSDTPSPRASRRLSLRESVFSLRESLASTFLPTSEAAAASQARTHERLRAAEERAREMEQLVERLKREAVAGPSATEAQLRILQLQYDSVRANSQTGPRPSAGLFKMSCATDLLFLLDATNSMRSYIDSAKEQICSIVTDINRSFFQEADVRVAIVAYRDHGDKKPRETLDFTTDTDAMFRFLNGVRATGGGDAAEDVLGALDAAMHTSWQQATRCVMHITDAPPHGRTLHDMEDRHDNYLVPSSEPHKLQHEDVIGRMVALKLNYVLMRINSHTDKMAFVFLQNYLAAAPDAKLLKTNKFYHDAVLLKANKLYVGAPTLKTASSTATTVKSTTSAQGGLHFNEVALGTQYSAMRHLVVSSVMASASRTAVRLSAASTAARSSRMSSGYTIKPSVSADPSLDAVREDDDEDEGDTDIKSAKLPPTQIDTIPPQWDVAGWLDTAEQFQAFSTDVTAAPGLLDRMLASDDHIRISTTELTVLRRQQPFAEGALRVAMYARTPESSNRLVVKAFKTDGKTLVDMAEEMRVQALCKAFVLEFNALAVGVDADNRSSSSSTSIDFTVVTCLQPKSATAAGTACLALEPLLEGTFVKYNSNCGGVSSDGIDTNASKSSKTDTTKSTNLTKSVKPAKTPKTPKPNHNTTAQAFSHFTFERSQGRFLICDLQGVGGVLTDPAVHTRDHTRFRLTDTNLNEEGFKLFFATHKCNILCERLRLQSSADMFITGPFVFRQDWPAADHQTGWSVCCANKLCGRIFRADDTRKTAPAFYWCTTCWPQLAATTQQVLCLAPGPQHGFAVSRFFYESQGQIRPRLCREHAVGPGSMPSDATVFSPPITPHRSGRSFFGARRS
ncbi:mhck ef2 kinase domain family protein protein [Grosmannia clavigera kw1407]|uniref:Mhck ef2 kinase domain family protein protein n=1 Tax=Grosmannia clavigera (strain kw1407 / UAMH 11150) TaxID=655863 RepID=F0XGA7_GROCL|nr:mhck ef2 kinase domain family protein [Grosmannia clavigera kw1407]EFX02721.1 mhck ef2 kinase domain family protein protein [Grosmannia clavigera kw1407]